jgi:hypothetical protein
MIKVETIFAVAVNASPEDIEIGVRVNTEGVSVTVSDDAANQVEFSLPPHLWEKLLDTLGDHIRKEQDSRTRDFASQPVPPSKEKRVHDTGREL